VPRLLDNSVLVKEDKNVIARKNYVPVPQYSRLNAVSRFIHSDSVSRLQIFQQTIIA
jgi:hypothetical protein